MMRSKPNYKNLKIIADTETYRTDTSTLLAYNSNNKIFLFRALNSKYFIQNDNDDSINIVSINEAREIWDGMPIKHIQNIVSAFPICL